MTKALVASSTCPGRGRLASAPSAMAGIDGLAHVLGGVEGVDVEAVADLAREPGQTGVDARYVDRDLRVIYWARVEERRHQGVPVELALELEGTLVLERIPDRTQGQDVLAQPRRGLVPGHREAAGYVGLDLRAEAEHEAAFGEVLEIPGGLRRLHGRAREGDGYGGAELYLAASRWRLWPGAGTRRVSSRWSTGRRSRGLRPRGRSCLFL